MRRDIFTEEHEAFRDMVREFIAREVTPHHEQWERDRVVSRNASCSSVKMSRRMTQP